ncbi:MAG: BatD family protein [Spirochaetia bacterium]|jgi:hypothetical protein|nr:BatD family protein [Spirochaetia bacterium]
MKRVVILLIITVLLSLSFPLFGNDIEIVAVVEKNILSVGESFIFQIQIKGSDNASNLPEDNWSDPAFKNSFNVEFLGGQNNSSRQISVINGRRKETINTAYIISWLLTPLKSGTLLIPSVTVNIEGKKYVTRSIKIESKEAEESENLKLLVSFDKDPVYVGEPLLIKFTWYIGMNINDFIFSIPFFKDNNFSFIDTSGSNPDPASLVRFPVDGVPVTAVQGKGTLKGDSFTTVTFSKLVIPKTPGNFNIPESVISVSAQISKGGRGSDLFSSFFSSVSPEYQQFTVPSNNLTLKVLPLPSIGKPDNFNGYIGELNIETSASPLNVRVGDPITFSMKISGPKNISEWDPPELQKQYELAANFKMPSEISAGKIDGSSVVFTQTIRSLNEAVTQIPALEIPYFDTLKGIYRIARSQPIPITVAKGSSVRVEGSTSSNPSDMQQEVVQALNNGINFNYNDIDILKNQSFGLRVFRKSPVILLLILPPLFFLVILFLIISKNIKFFPNKNTNKNSLSEITKELKKIESNLNSSSEEPEKKVKILFQRYILNKISGSGGFITEKDVNNSNFPLIFEAFSLIDEIQYAGVNIQNREWELKLKSLINKVILALEDFEGRIK